MRRIREIFFLIIYRTVATRLPFSFWPLFGQPCSEFRRLVLNGMGCQISPGCVIEPWVNVGFSPQLIIGSGCQVNEQVTLRTAIIDQNVMVAPGVVFLDRQHVITNVHIPMVDQGDSGRVATIVEEDVWIGTNAIIMPGIRIGRGAVVAAGAVVTRDVGTFDVVGGVPARKLKNRKVDSRAVES